MTLSLFLYIFATQSIYALSWIKMGRRNLFEDSLPFIENFFDRADFRSFSERKFEQLFEVNKLDWQITIGKYPKELLQFLVRKKLLFENYYTDNFNQNKILYSWKTQDEYTVMTGLKTGSYFTFYSAMFFHQLTLQIPKTYYLNFEHSESSAFTNGSEITQESIDRAFAGSQRKSKVTAAFIDKKVIITNGKYTGKLGVIRQQNNQQCFGYTNLERTLIDIAVRPVYAGGVFEVLEAYRQAKGKLNVLLLKQYLDQLNYVYPYQQVVGFYLEKAGFSPNEYLLFDKKKEFRFYLTYDIRQKEFSKEWSLYHPKGL